MSIPFHTPIPFAEDLGFTLERMGDGEAEVNYAPRPEHANSMGITHGGALMALLDMTMSVAARSVQPECSMVTIEIKTTFMQPAPLGSHGALVAHGKLLHRSRKMAFVEGTVHDAQGRLCVHGIGTFKYTLHGSGGGGDG